MASRLPLPEGMSPTGTGFPASAPSTSRVVPSPPRVSSRSAPSTAASRAIPAPWSSAVVGIHTGGGQPRLAVSRDRKRSSERRPRTRPGCHTTWIVRGFRIGGVVFHAPVTVAANAAEKRATIAPPRTSLTWWTASTSRPMATAAASRVEATATSTVVRRCRESAQVVWTIPIARAVPAAACPEG